VGATAGIEADTKGGTVKILITADGSKAATIAITLQDPMSGPAVPDRRAARGECRALEEKDYVNATGVLDLALSRTTLSQLCPRVLHTLPVHQLAVLLASTRLVGMTCPGLHSMYRELKLQFSTADVHAPLEMKWAVEQFDSRFHVVDLQIEAPGARGTIMGFVRPSPVRQPSMADLKPLIPAHAYASQTALVVGGSRGLGELTAKMLAAGGAHVLATYHSGRDDAEAVVRDIRSAGGRSEAVAFDVCGTDASSLPRAPTHVYYFATPYIGAGTKGQFRNDVFERLRRVYADGLSRTIELALRATDGATALKVFYPSSVFVDDPPPDMAEYVAAKKAGETLCRELMASERRLDIHITRLPRMATDQTVSLVSVDYADAFTVMKGVLDAM
jgi:NADP-dependent 3-hydroxy acid dehydrogenase YdfG